MRILHVAPFLAARYGGIPMAVRQSARAASLLGHEVEIVTTNIDGDSVIETHGGRATPWEGLTVAFHPTHTPRRFLTSWSMLKDLRRRVPQFDVVHVHAFYRFHSVAAALAVMGPRRPPYIVQPHGSFDPWHRRRRKLAKDAYHAVVEDPIIRRSAGLVCTSQREADAIQMRGYRTRMWIVPIAIDVEGLQVPEDAGPLLGRLGVDDDSRLVTFLGRISAKKGVDLLVEGFATIASQCPDARLVIAGPDDEGIATGLRPRIEALGLADRIITPGTITGGDKRSLLQRSAAFVLASADESFGIAAAEAMAVGCPVIVSSDVAIADVIKLSGAGIVIGRTAADIAAAVLQILRSPASAAAMGAAGRRASAESFGMARVGAALEAMYREVVGA